MSENSGFAMVPAWLIARKPSASAERAYIRLALRGRFNPGSAQYEGVTISMETLAADMDVSRPTAVRAVAELEELGGLTRTSRRAGSKRLTNEYVIHFGQVVAPDDKSAGEGEGITDEPFTSEHDRRERITHEPLTSDPGPITQLRNPETDPSSLRSSGSAHKIVKSWVDWLGERPPGRVVGQVSRLIGEMLAEGIAPAAIKRGLAEMSKRSLNPSVLPSLVHEQQVRQLAPQRPDMAPDRAVAERPTATPPRLPRNWLTAEVEAANRASGERMERQFAEMGLAAGGPA